MAKAKGIRVNQLAKELGIASKAILDRCKTEGLGDKVPNHMSLMSLGLAETVREWFADGGAGVATAVETATEEAAEPKRKTTTRRRKKSATEEEAGAEHTDEASGEEIVDSAGGDAEPGLAAVVPSEEPAAPTAEAAPVAAAPEPPAEDVPVEVPVGPVAEAEAPQVPMAAAPTEPAPAESEVPAATTPAASEVAGPIAAPPAEAAPRVTEVVPHAVAKHHAAGKHPAKPAPVARKPVTPAPQLVVPAPAKIQGPRIVREEKPDVVAAPRRRTPMQGAGSQPAFVQAKPQGGRGVRSTTIEDGEEDAAAKKKAGKSGRTLSSRRRGPDGRRGEALEKLREWSEADLIERRDRLAAASSYRAGFDSDLRKKSERGQHTQARSAVEKGGGVEVEEPITIRSLSAALGVKTNELMLKLMRQGIMANVNASLTRETAGMLALDYGLELRVKQQQTMEQRLEEELASRTPKPDDLVTRPPVVTILGHVDHGKTSLLDRIRQANVAAGEAGGITQHIAAWKVQIGERRVAFIDTPGHQAFTSMRARGAAITDVVVLVVSAAEGVQPQTIESINHAKAAGVPLVVALNKIDRPDANEQMVLGQLAAQGLNPVEWGGDTEVVRTSATTGQGIQELIEILDYQSELLELKADPTAPAVGTVIESRVDEGLGSVATVLVQDGTLRPGDIVLSGSSYGRVRSLINDRGGMVAEAGPSTPVIISGLDSLPQIGDKFYVVPDMERARSIAEDRENRMRQEQLAAQNRVSTAASIFETMRAAQVKTINLIIKGDVQGSVETLAKTVTDQNTDEVKVKVIHAAVGGITESDVELAAATREENSGTVIIGFHVVPDEAARVLAEQRHVEIRQYRVIYEIFDDLKKALSGMLEPEIREKLHGHAEIRQVFKVSRVGNIAGCMVTDGHLQRGSRFRLIRDGKIIVEDLSLDSLKRLKDDVREVKSGFECGLKLAGYDDIKVGDRLEAYVRETIHRTL